MYSRPSRLVLSMLMLVTVLCAPPSRAQVPLPPHSGHHDVRGEAGSPNGPETTHAAGSWDGSAQGIAYSEFNHRFVGLFVLLFGLAELGQAAQLSVPLWIRLVLPGALGVVGVFLLVWSDHEAWPIGSLSFVQTFFGEDWEIIQHKIYGILAAASSETLRRIGWVKHPAWAVPLVVLGIGGGLLLFVHSHGPHPSNEMIDLHHALMGSLGIAAASSKAIATWMAASSSRSVRVWETVWGGLILLTGVQLLFYFE
jgi:hypothetical protein